MPSDIGSIVPEGSAESISQKIGQLKLAAIDAVMREEDMIISEVDGRMIYVESHVLTTQLAGFVRPDEWSGEGGGEGIGLREGQSAAAAFERVRMDVDRILAPWLWLPRPEKLQLALSATERAISGLSAGQAGASSGGDEGQLGILMDRLRDESSAEAYGGGVFVDFKRRYVDASRLRSSSITGQCALLSQALLAEAAIWNQVPRDLARIIDYFTTGFRAIAARSTFGASDQILLKVVGAVLTAVGAVASVGTAPAVFGAIVFGTSIAASAVDIGGSLEVEGGGSGYQTTFPFSDVGGGTQQLARALDVLSSEIAREESRLRGGIERALEKPRTSPERFELPPRSTQDWDGKTAKYGHPARNRDIATRYMPEAAALVLEPVRHLAEVPGEFGDATYRDSIVGRASQGPTAEIAALTNQIVSLMRALSDDLLQGAQWFADELDDLEAMDNAHARLVHGLQSDLDAAAKNS